MPQCHATSCNDNDQRQPHRSGLMGQNSPGPYSPWAWPAGSRHQPVIREQMYLSWPILYIYNKTLPGMAGLCLSYRIRTISHYENLFLDPLYKHQAQNNNRIRIIGKPTDNGKRSRLLVGISSLLQVG